VSSSFERRLEKQFLEVIPGVTPGLMVQVYKMGRKVADITVGETATYYDLASVTKIIFTTQALMKAFDEGKWNLESKVCDFVVGFPHKEMLVKECMNHSSGLQWWEPFYKVLDLKSDLEERWKKLFEVIYGLPLEKKDQSVYSDVGFLVLGRVLCEIYQKSLIEIWNAVKTEFYSGTSLEFHPRNEPRFERKLYAPTENGDWRGKILQGEVNDDNTWALGGVAPHAGLFGSLDDLSWYGQLLRAQLHGIAKNSIRSKTAKVFATRSRPEGEGDWSLGFMMPSKEGSLVGNYFSPESLGHWGFTGTSVWYDPRQDLCVSVLSNRTLFGRERKDFNLLRPRIHNWIVEGLRRA
jgi:CubicO group peptidase (beta-lactamase class C family)